MIFEEYCLHGIGLGEICEKLNGDLERYPPPKRNPKDEMPLPRRGVGRSFKPCSETPKYTGYNVWGRHDKRRGRPFIRPRAQRIWSAAPTHAPLVPKELFDLVERAGEPD